MSRDNSLVCPIPHGHQLLRDLNRPSLTEVRSDQSLEGGSGVSPADHLGGRVFEAEDRAPKSPYVRKKGFQNVPGAEGSRQGHERKLKEREEVKGGKWYWVPSSTVRSLVFTLSKRKVISGFELRKNMLTYFSICFTYTEAASLHKNVVFQKTFPKVSMRF